MQIFIKIKIPPIGVPKIVEIPCTKSKIPKPFANRVTLIKSTIITDVKLMNELIVKPKKKQYERNNVKFFSTKHTKQVPIPQIINIEQ